MFYAAGLTPFISGQQCALYCAALHCTDSFDMQLGCAQDERAPEVGGVKPSIGVLIQRILLQHPVLSQWREWRGGGGSRGWQGAADGLLCGVEHVPQCGLQPQQNSSGSNNDDACKLTVR